jgi:hypothetical protein
MPGPVDDTGRLSEPAGRITAAKDSDPEPPTAPTVGTWPGVKPTTIKRKTSRLMHSVPDLSDTPPPPCPTCGNPASSSSVRRQSGALNGDYLCPAGHIWTTRWMEVA